MNSLFVQFLSVAANFPSEAILISSFLPSKTVYQLKDFMVIFFTEAATRGVL